MKLLIKLAKNKSNYSFPIYTPNPNFLLSKINKDYKSGFTQLIDKSNLNKRRRRLHLFLHEVTRVLAVN